MSQAQPFRAVTEAEAELFLRDQLPLVRQSMIPTTLKTAYDAASATKVTTSALGRLSATDYLPLGVLMAG